MFNVVTGCFHPDLEEAVAEDLRRIKASHPFSSVLIIVPSEPLRTRLKWLLCAEQDYALLNVHFHTFFQVALRVVDEQGRGTPPSIRSDFFFKNWLHQHLRDRVDALPEWESLIEMPGAWAALWATLKDLKDAAVEAGPAVEALNQSSLGFESGRRSLFRVYQWLMEERARRQMYDRDDCAVLALEDVTHSAFLSRQTHILYYGFYDLTQVQLDLFQKIARTYPTTLYFPLIRGHPAFLFSSRFFERYIHGMATGTIRELPISRSRSFLFNLFRPSGDEVRAPEPFSSSEGITPSPQRSDQLPWGPGTDSCDVPSGGKVSYQPRCQVVQVSGIEDEVAVIAKEILALVEERNVGFHEIGVVGRTLAGYETVVPRIFSQHGIPFHSTMNRALITFPLVKTAIQLLELRNVGFPRAHTIDLLASPVLRLKVLCPDLERPRPDLWDLVSRRLGIIKGFQEWQRIQGFSHTGLPLHRGREEEEWNSRIPADQVSGLWSALSALNQALGVFPDQASWEDYVDLAKDLFERLLDFGLGESNGPDWIRKECIPGFAGGEPDFELSIGGRFLERIEELRALGQMSPSIPLTDFVAAFRRLMDEPSVPIPSTTQNWVGVSVLDAMAARGLPFRALFVLGLTEKVFPRSIQEDSFLPDRLRRFLEVTLGFKIQEKLSGVEEETLLFYLVVNSAREFLTLLYQHSDGKGRSQIPSVYLGEVQRILDGVPNVVVPRRLTEKIKRSPWHPGHRLTPQEVGITCLLDCQVPNGLWPETQPSWSLLAQGLRVIGEQEIATPRLGMFDGITGSLENFWVALRRRGLSPTALERYARCPFQYFAGQVLRLEPLMVPEAVYQVGPMELGTLGHQILRDCVKTVREAGYFSEESPTSVDPHQILEKVAAPVFEEFANANPVGYPLIWELQQERLLSVLGEMLAQDLLEMAEGWEPILFEELLKGSLTVPMANTSEVFPISGRVDRVDWSASKQAYRVVDYKFTEGTGPRPSDKNLVREAVRGTRLQPPFYLALANGTVPGMIDDIKAPTRSPTGLRCEGVWFYVVALNRSAVDGPLTRVRFPGDAWDSPLKSPMERAIRYILEGIQGGQFFIFPGDYCGWCHFEQICHKTHPMSAWRARTDHERVRLHRALRRAQPHDVQHEIM